MAGQHFESVKGLELRMPNKIVFLRRDWEIGYARRSASERKRDILLERLAMRKRVVEVIVLVLLRILATAGSGILWMLPIAWLASMHVRTVMLGFPTGMAIAMSWIVIWTSNWGVGYAVDRVIRKRKKG